MRHLGFGFALVLLLTSGCSLGTVGGRKASKAEPASDEIDELKEHIVALERRAAMVEVEVKRLRKRLSELESETTPVSAASPLESEGGDSSRPRERPADAAPARAPDSSPTKIEVSDLSAETEQLSAPTAESAPVREPSDSEDALSASAQALYDRGYTLFHQGRYVDSETAFQQFLQRFDATVLGDNAQFWIAESRYARGDVSGALAAFRETVTRFPEGNKASDAELNIGDCLRDLGDIEGARRSYRKVIESHPSSAAAAIADERLASLR